MARETKVGLLAGLAFIICFAVILTNRGQRVPFRPSPQVVDATHRSQPTRSSTPSAGADLPRAPLRRQAPRQDPEPHRSSWRRPHHDAAVVDGDGVLGEPPAPPFDANRQRPPRPRPTVGIQTRQSALPPDGAAKSGYRTTDAGLGGTVTPAPTSLASSRTPADPHAALRSAIEAGRPPVPVTPRDRSTMVKYTVAPGDTLSRIAANHYGRATSANVHAIVSANRSVIANPDVLHPGVTIVLPELDRATAAPVPTTASKKKSGAPDSSRSGSRHAGSFTWYQIRPNDRYISIAREQLGDASRWEEIFALNRDKFPDPGKIRVGVRIKLPIDRSASAGGRR